MPDRTRNATDDPTAAADAVTEQRRAADATRQSLIEAALDRFGARGFEAASTREIANGAGSNIGSIAYHFGGKDGLRRAAAEYVVDIIRSVARAALGDFGLDAAAPPMPPEEARRHLDEGIGRMVRFVLVQPQARLIVRFMLREIANPSVALDIIYAGVVEPTHGRICRLWAAATGDDPQAERVRLSVFAFIGQVFYFRIGQEIVLRRMGWKAYGPAEADAIAGIVVRNLHACLDAEIAANRAGRA